MKGFIFSIEALLAVTLLIFSLFVITTYVLPGPYSEIFVGRLYSDGINSVYFNEINENTPNLNLYCENFVHYDLLTLESNNFSLCRGYS
jgi:hypothetical protein